MAWSDPHRLPTTVTPERYELVIEPDLPNASFDGTVTVSVIVDEPVTEILLNAVDITIHEAFLHDGPDPGEAARVTLIPEVERASLLWERPISAGPHRLTMRFTGVLADSLRGFYRTTVRNGAGEPELFAVTQCESTDARRVLPCWDEPAFKARFQITLVVDPHLTALSNGPETASHVLANGKKQVTFGETIPMSTYLMALVVGRLTLTDPVLAGEVPVRIAARPERAGLTGLAETAAVHAVQFFTEYFGVPYPGDKLDHVAVPNFAAGAMENLGCVTYRESALLADPSRASAQERQRIASVIAHETAHMWFGDLVTMRWWNGIWLNEAFATFMQMLAIDDFEPSWQVWTQFGMGRAMALQVDGLAATRPIEFPVGSPAEAAAMFDVLTYQKGSAVLRMLEQHLGDEVFRRGIQHYLTTHRYDNTETHDLWESLEAVSHEPVGQMMDSWILHPGHPQIAAALAPDQTSVILTQRPFVYRGMADAHTWQVPITLAMLTRGGGSAREHLLLGHEAVTVDLPARAEAVLVNHGGYGFYRVVYDDALWRRLLPMLGQLSSLERLNLTADVWASVLAHQAPLAQAADLWRTLPHERAPEVWDMAARQWELLDSAAQAGDHAAVADLVGTIAGPVFHALGWEGGPDPEDERTLRVRAVVIRLLGTIGRRDDVAASCRRRLNAHWEGTKPLPPDLLNAVSRVVAYTGGLEDWDRFHQAFKDAATPQDEARWRGVLAAFTDETALRRTLALYLSDEVRTQDGPQALGALLSNRHAARMTWDTVESQWEDLLDRWSPEMMGAVLSPIAGIVDESLAARIAAWLPEHQIPALTRRVAQAAEFQTIHRDLARRLAGRMREALDGGGEPTA